MSNFFCHFRVAIFGAIYLKTPHLRFFLKFVKISQKAQLRIDILWTLLVFWVFLAQKAEKLKKSEFHKFPPDEDLSMTYSTLNVRWKCLTSSIFFKFCRQPYMAIKWWHAYFEKKWSTFRDLFGHFAGVTFSVPKNGPKRPQYSKCSSYIKKTRKIFFFI